MTSDGMTMVKTISERIPFIRGTSVALEILDKRTNEIMGDILQIKDTYVPEEKILIRTVVYRRF